MKHILIAVALLGAAYYMATKDKLRTYVPYDDRDLVAVDPETGALITEDPAQVEAKVFDNQIEALSYHLKQEPQATKAKIVTAIAACFPDDTADMVVESLAGIVQITAQSYDLTKEEQPGYIHDQVARLSDVFDAWANTQPDQIRDQALNTFMEQMNDPLTLINCNAEWLDLPG